MKKRILSSILALLLAVTLMAGTAGAAAAPSEALTAMAFSRELGCGINLGNSLDVAHMLQYDPDMDPAAYEMSWGNPLIAKGQFTAIRSAGFSTVRIPVSWDEHMAADATIDAAFMDRVQEVVDMALDSGLYVIIDTHHEDRLDLELDRKDEIVRTFSSMWVQIAVRFRDYDERLIFEGLNEPRLQGSPQEWTGGTKDLQAFVNELDQAFVSAVRSTGGKNAHRFLMVCPYCDRVEADALEALVLPDDDRLIVAVHLYQPSDFCLDAHAAKNWRSDKRGRDDMEQKFLLLNRYLISKGIPVVITETGCIDKSNTPDRIQWTQDLVGYCRQYDIPYLWWDDGGDFQLLDRENGTWLCPEIVQALTSTDRTDS